MVRLHPFNDILESLAPDQLEKLISKTMKTTKVELDGIRE